MWHVAPAIARRCQLPLDSLECGDGRYRSDLRYSPMPSRGERSSSARFLGRRGGGAQSPLTVLAAMTAARSQHRRGRCGRTQPVAVDVDYEAACGLMLQTIASCAAGVWRDLERRVCCPCARGRRARARRAQDRPDSKRQQQQRAAADALAAAKRRETVSPLYSL